MTMTDYVLSLAPKIEGPLHTAVYTASEIREQHQLCVDLLDEAATAVEVAMVEREQERQYEGVQILRRAEAPLVDALARLRTLIRECGESISPVQAQKVAA